MRLLPLAAGAVTTTLAAALLVPTAPAAATTQLRATRPASQSVRVTTPTLVRRALLPADHRAAGPPSGAKATPGNGRTGPFPGQVVPGFSGLVDNGKGTFWALPDNGFGSKANSADFRLRLYLVKPSWETGTGGSGRITVKKYISLRDPDHKIGFPLVRGATKARLLTGADLDPESVVRGSKGSFWIGDEFGPYLVHVSSTGRVLAAPVPFPRGKSPDNPTLRAGDKALVPRSRGFEALARSAGGRYLYPVLEGALTGDRDGRRRIVSQFDVKKNRYTSRTWSYQTDTAGNRVADAHLTGKNQLLVLERDDFEGPAAVTKRIYRVDLGRRDADGFAPKTLVADLLQLANPAQIGVKASPGAYGVGREFSFPFRSVEALVPLANGDLVLANDTNYPVGAARRPGRPDDTEMIQLHLRTVTVEDPTSTLVAHRGASGYRPEHTLASYALAIRMCADYIEPDVVATRDGVLVVRHENEISATTDVASLRRFAGRRTTKRIDGHRVTGWFTEDFTLAELRTLRAKERLPGVRPGNTRFDGLYEIPTLDEVVDLARHSRTCSGHRVGVYPETKHPTYFRSIRLPLETRLLTVLAADGYSRGSDPVFIQSFETANLRALAPETSIRLVQLVDCSGAPYDLSAAGDRRSYADLVTPQGLREIRTYADGVGLCKDLIIPRDRGGRLTAPTPVVADAHAVGLSVVGWTFRRENRYLPTEFRSSSDSNAPGDLAGEIRVFLAAGMDGFFTDDPDVGYRAVLGISA